MPDINPDIDTAVHKFFLAQTALRPKRHRLGSKYVRNVDSFFNRPAGLQLYAAAAKQRWDRPAYGTNGFAAV